LRITQARPDYFLFENNCQNFAKYLLEAISPGSYSPRPISDIIKRWLTATSNPQIFGRLPGAYPNSTALDTFWTAVEGEWTTERARSLAVTSSINGLILPLMLY
jgi:hypothetical protein